MDIGVIIVGDDQSPGGNYPDQVMELGLDLVKVPENIGMVELDAGNHGDVGAIRMELRPLRKKSAVVLVSFKHDDTLLERHCASGLVSRRPQRLELPWMG